MMGMSRARSARERWLGIVREQQGSGLTVAAFCNKLGIAESSFYPWKRRLAETGNTDEESMFVEAKIGADDRRGEHGVTVVLAGGRRIIVGPGFDRRVLLEVIETLESGAGARA